MKKLATTGIFPLIILLMLGCGSSPESRINKNASLQEIEGLPENPLEMTPLAVGLQPGGKTMFTLYGNNIAAERLKEATAYANGSVLYLVSWKGKADSDWLGARIPGSVVSVERVSIDQDGTKDYAFFKGLAQSAGVVMKKEDRIATVLSVPLAKVP